MTVATAIVVGFFLRGKERNWWAVLGSNQWPLPCEGSALPLS
jgi:hypothetical protein